MKFLHLIAHFMSADCKRKLSVKADEDHTEVKGLCFSVLPQLQPPNAVQLHSQIQSAVWN